MHMNRHPAPALRPSQIAMSAVLGERLFDEDRARLPPALLGMLATGGHIELTEVDRYRLPKSTLVQLAVAGVVTLSRRERDRLSPAVLAQLIVGAHTTIQPDEFQRLPRSLRELVSAHAAKTEMRITVSG
jgi:hypothetical protein